MTMTVPSKTAHGRTLGYAERIECSSKPKVAICDVDPRSAIDACRGGRHHTHGMPQGGRSLEDHRNRERNVLHEASHVYLTPRSLTGANISGSLIM
jgi:hypothetical protein